MSQALQQLEDQLGVTLVDRTQRPIELTSAGAVYFERCQRWLDEYREIEDEIGQLSGRITGRVRVASIYSVGLLQMSGYVRRFREEFPEVDLKLDYSQPDEVYERILRDDVDLGIVSFPRDSGDVGCISWCEQEMVLAVATDHELANRKTIELSQLSEIDLVAFTKNLTIRRETEKRLRQANVEFTVVHQFDNLETIKRAVEINLGVAILPLATLRRELEFETLKAVHFSDCTFVRPLGIVHRRHKHLSRAADKFVGLLHEDFSADEATPKPAAAIGSQFA